MKLPDRVTITQFLHIRPHWQTGEPEFVLLSSDISGSSSGMACLGSVPVTFDVPQVDPIVAMIDGLERQISAERASSQLRVNLLQDQISKLTCIEQERAA